jgi:prepilin-type N-terminal cleavage/methylation domain-containing protein
MRSPTVTRGQQRAFTLLELMIAMALLGVTMV